MKKSTTTATRKVNVTICVQLSEKGQRNEIKKGRSGKPQVLVKGRISPEDVDLFKVDADGRLLTEQRHDSVLTVDELLRRRGHGRGPPRRQGASVSRKRNHRVDRSLDPVFLAGAATSHAGGPAGGSVRMNRLAWDCGRHG